MFTLYTRWDAERELAPEDIQFILSPDHALEMACIFYQLDYLQYNQRSHIIAHRIPDRRERIYHRYAAQPYQRKHIAQYDGLYDEVKWNLNLGWMVGVDRHEQWDYVRNPFFFDDDSNLVYDCFMDSYGESFQREVRHIYQCCLNEHQGRKPAPTVKNHYFDAPVQHAQAAKTINSKAAGRLLAAGGIYNGNPEGFHQTARQLGGDAPVGYDQVIDNKGIIIAGASAVAGVGLGRVGVISKLSNYSKIPTFESPYSNGFSSRSGVLLNAEHAVVDYRKLSTYSLDPTHPVGGHKAKVFQSALGYNTTNADILGARIQEGILKTPAKMLDPIRFGQPMSVDLPILGVNGETAIVRTGWIYEADSVVPRLTTIFVK